jgi:hypothetical protein
MRVDASSPTDAYTPPSTPAAPADKPSQPAITTAPSSLFGRTAIRTEASKQVNDDSPSMASRVDSKPRDDGGAPGFGQVSSMPGRPKNAELDRRGDLFERAIKATPELPDPTTYVSDKLNDTFDPDGSKQLDPEKTYVGYHKDGKVVLGGSMLKYAATQTLEGAPDGKSPEELSFFKLKPGAQSRINEEGSTTVDAGEVEQYSDLSPDQVRAFSWKKDYHDAYSHELDDNFQKLGPALEGNFKINYLQKLEQEHDAGLLSDDDRRIAQRAMGLQGGELYSQLGAKDLEDTAPQSDIKISPLTIGGHQAVNALVMSDKQTGRTVLYLGGMKGPFHSFANTDQMKNWLSDKLKSPETARDLARYFPDAAKEMPELFKQMGEQGSARASELLDFPDAQIPPGHGIGHYEVNKNQGVLQRIADESLVTQGEVQRGEFADAMHKALGFLEPLFLMGGSRGLATGFVGKLGEFGFDLWRHHVAIRSDERNESDLDALVSGKDRNLLKGIL